MIACWAAIRHDDRVSAQPSCLPTVLYTGGYRTYGLWLPLGKPAYTALHALTHY